MQILGQSPILHRTKKISPQEPAQGRKPGVQKRDAKLVQGHSCEDWSALTPWESVACCLPNISCLLELNSSVSFQLFGTMRQELRKKKQLDFLVSWLGLPTSNPTISFSSPLAFSLSQHQILFQWLGSSHQVAKVLELQFQHQSFQWIFSVYFCYGWPVWFPYCPRDFQESCPLSLYESINSLVFSLLYGLILTSVHDYWKNHNFDYMDLCWQRDVYIFKYMV